MTANKIQSRRSFIFTPGNRPELFTKALASGADIVCVELEDGVAPHDKDDARAKMLELFAAPHPDDGIERIVRINALSTDDGKADIAADAHDVGEDGLAFEADDKTRAAPL